MGRCFCVAAACACVGAFVIAAAPLAADQVFLKSGEVLKGRVVAQDETSLRIDTGFGIVPLAKTAIANIVYERPPDRPDTVNVFTKTTVYRGTLLKQSPDELVVRTGHGEFTIPKAQVEHVDWKSRVEFPERSNADLRLGGLWRSALLPGWGQFWQGRAGWGWTYAAATAGAVVLAIAARASYTGARDDYLSHVEDPARRARADDRRLLYNAAVVAAGALWLWQAGEGALFAPRHDTTRPVISLAPAVDAPGLGCALAWRF